MTDKQIIIDGVDVSGCNFTLERDGKIKCECTHATGFGVICDCESWKTCDYKNYKCKEQECNKLYIQLKADEEYHKEEENTLRKIIKNKEERNIKLYKENNKLKQTLTEIKPTLEFYANSKMGEEQPDKTYHIMLNGGYIMVYDPKPARQALQKISSNRCLLAGTNRIKR